MSLSLDFTGKTVLVTGGTKGIGAAIVEDFKQANADLLITGARSKEEITSINNKLKETKVTKIKYFHADFSNKTSLHDLFTILNNYDRIDVCVNNAGTNRNNRLEKITPEDYHYLMDVNLHAPFLVTQYVSNTMRKHNYGRIINIASIWSAVTKTERAAYTITKTGLVGLTKTSAVELAPYNVLVNAVSPGFTLTELTKKNLPQNEIGTIIETIPIKRFAYPPEIAKLVLFLASDLNTYITGQNIVIDGGFTIV